MRTTAVLVSGQGSRTKKVSDVTNTQRNFMSTSDRQCRLFDNLVGVAYPLFSARETSFHIHGRYPCE